VKYLQLSVFCVICSFGITAIADEGKPCADASSGSSVNSKLIPQTLEEYKALEKKFGGPVRTTRYRMESFPDDNLTITATYTGERSQDYDIRAYSRDVLIHSFNTQPICDRTKLIDEIVRHQPSDGESRYVGIRGLGLHGDVYYIMKFRRSGTDEWLFETDCGDNVRRHRCGVVGLSTRLVFDEGTAIFSFGVGSGVPGSGAECILRIRYENGAWIGMDGN